MRTYGIIVVSTLFAGIALFAFMNGWIIIRVPGIHGYTTAVLDTPLSSKKQITLHYYHHDQWQKETQTLVMTDQKDIAIQQLVSAWLYLLEEEKIIHKKIALEGVLLDAKQATAYLSFDRTFFTKQQTIFQKWMMIEGLLKTLQENKIAVTHVTFLIHHKLLIDHDLDFSKPWPIHGFI